MGGVTAGKLGIPGECRLHSMESVERGMEPSLVHVGKGKGLAFDGQPPGTNRERDWGGKQAPEHEGASRSPEGTGFCSR